MLSGCIYMFSLNWRWWFGLKPRFASQKPKNYSISVVIPAYNEGESISDTIDSIRVQTVKIDKIIVIDDCSTDKTGEVARGKGAVVLRTPENQGTKAMAQNFAIPTIETELIVTIDADTLLAPDAIEKTLPYFNNPKTASVCGFVIPQRIETVWERGRFIEYLSGQFFAKGAQENIGAILVSTGCFSVLRTSLLKAFNGFNPRTIAEDMDLTWNMALEGYHIHYCKEAKCFPIDPPTGRIFVNQIDRWFRGYLQNISLHNFQKNKKLGVIIYGYLLEIILSPFILLTMLFLYTKSVMIALLLALPLEIVLFSPVWLITGAFRGKFWKTLTSIPAYIIVRPVNLFVFWRAVWKEWIKKEKLSKWNKGH